MRLSTFVLCFPVCLFFGRSSDRANVCARTAADAFVGIDNVFAVAFADCADRATFRACAAHNAVVTDHICHIHYLTF